MKQKTFVYICGSYRGNAPTHDWRSYWEIEQNIAEAGKWAGRLANNQIPFFCPHLNSRHFEVITPNVPPEFWLNMDMVLLEFASSLLALPNYGRSQGALAEIVRAQELGIPIFYASLNEDESDFAGMVEFWDKV